jgi:hypothetical protein
MSWKTFLKAHWGAIAATDFFTIEAITWRGLVRYFVLFVIDLQTRRVQIAGVLTSPDGAWMHQVARNWTAAKTDSFSEPVISFTTVIRSSQRRFGQRSRAPASIQSGSPAEAPI